MLINNPQDELKKRTNSLKIIKSIFEKYGREGLIDLTGLSGGFKVSLDEISLLETYLGPAIFEEKLEILAKLHLGGEKVLAFNRTSSGILATVMALFNNTNNNINSNTNNNINSNANNNINSNANSNINSNISSNANSSINSNINRDVSNNSIEENKWLVHYSAEKPGHPAIERSVNLCGGKYIEFDDLDEFHIPKNTLLLVITGSTMDHKIIDEKIFKKLIEMAHEESIPVFVDDASGARIRTAIYNQKAAIELGADLVITSTDKLMSGPRGGLMSGKKDLINKIKVKSNQFGLEAQSSAILAMINGLKSFDSSKLLESFEKRNDFLDILRANYPFFKETPTGVLIDETLLKSFLSDNNNTNNSNNNNNNNNNNNSYNYFNLNDFSLSDLSFILSFILLKSEGIITIPAVSMPGASSTIRFDFASNDALDLNMEVLASKFESAFDKFLKVINSIEKSRLIVFGQ
ncbi:PLP-dependent aminotransferase family protein [Methanobrevibacter curvatus]|uniref:L-seryl-tRNA(Sec) selenium transferase n=1 Tax=Methanobrevibacter curvatus TaxID=49547 RepID=A0A165ZUT3_9EURY|nr:PLP-dependent transferase [Methanobrevibacter curvatus]KZX11191.1 L-seryl-tRNA(Sec) selenium transferase [Methanobrevibacter curvatus]